jgi:MFS transporter, DHA2 family, multidrug resistance protein
VLYASLVLLPIYLQTLLGYPAYNAGLALSPRGIGSLLTMPVTGYLTSKTDPRRLIVVGLLLGCVTMFSLSHLNLNAGYWDIFWPQVFQGVALALLFIPIMTLAMSSIPKEKMGNATSIFNLMRNIGGSFGIAIMTTFLARRNQFHQTSLAAHVTVGDLKTREIFAGLRAHFHLQGSDSVTASRKAAAALYGMVQQHAAMLSFVEAFWIMSLMFLAMLPFVLLLRRPSRRAELVTTPAEHTTHPEPASLHPEDEKSKAEEQEEAYELLLH